MIVKDEVYVAYLLTCPEKYQRDRKRYNIDSTRGDRVVYRHLFPLHCDAVELVFAVGTSLDDHVARLHLIGIDQGQRHTIGPQLLHQRPHAVGHARALPLRIKVAHPGVQRTTVPRL